MRAIPPVSYKPRLRRSGSRCSARTEGGVHLPPVGWPDRRKGGRTRLAQPLTEYTLVPLYLT
jgi:hypothetical protein